MSIRSYLIQDPNVSRCKRESDRNVVMGLEIHQLCPSHERFRLVVTSKSSVG